MKSVNLTAICLGFFGLVASASFGADTGSEYKIEVCSIPLSQIVIPKARQLVAAFNLQHMFVRGFDGQSFTGLNFQPQNPMNVMGDAAEIGKQNYEQAFCKSIVSTSNKQEYDDAWKKIVDEFELATRTHRYSVIGKHCQAVTEEVLVKLGYSIPQEISAKFQQQNELQKGLNGCAQQ